MCVAFKKPKGFVRVPKAEPLGSASTPQSALLKKLELLQMAVDNL
jgi:hypothetical protein